MRSILDKDSTANKHSYLLESLLKRNDITVANFISEEGMTCYGIKDIWNTPQNRKREFEYVCKKNNIDAHKIRILTEYQDILENDIVIAYLCYSKDMNCMAKMNRGIKLVNINHFFVLYSEDRNHPKQYYQPDMLKKAKCSGIICEANVVNNSDFFVHYYQYDGKFVLNPYVCEQRFQKIRKFGDRKNKAAIFGSVEIRPELNDFYGENANLHPMRKLLYDEQKNYEKEISCYVTMVERKIKTHKFMNYKDDEWLPIKMIKKLYNYIHMPRPYQNYIASYDAVEKMNEYKMFAYPEEVTGVPALGFVEGMSCGSAYIGVESYMYSDLGMVSGRDYIGYDGTLDDMIEKIRYYQKHNDELEQIAENGYRFVKENLNAEIVCERFIQQLKDMLNEKRNKDGVTTD